MGRTRHTRKRHTRRKRKKKRTRRRRRSRHKRKRTRHRRRPRRGGAGNLEAGMQYGGGRVCKSGGKTPLMVSDIPPGPGFKKYAQKDKKQARAYLKKLKEGGGTTFVEL